MAHGDAQEGKWRGNWRMEGVSSTLRTTWKMVYPALLPQMRTPQLPVVNWTDAPADLNGLIRFTKRWNMVFAHVPSHFKRSIHTAIGICHTGYADCLLTNSQHNLYVLLCVQCWTPDDEQRNCLKHVEFYSKNKFEKLVHRVGFIIRMRDVVLSVAVLLW